MIGTIDIEIQAKNPNMPLWPLRAYIGSPSSLRVRNVPKKIGKWEITAVRVSAVYPDKELKTAQCVLTGGVWVGTVEGSSASGSCANGYTVFADGVDENGDPVSGYVLGRGDVEILKADGTPIEDPTHFVTDDELESAISGKAEISDVADVADDLAGLSGSLSGYYLKSETSSATEISNALDGKQPTGDYALTSQLPTKTSELSNDSGYITSAQVEPAQTNSGFAQSARNSGYLYNLNSGTIFDDLNQLALPDGQPTVESTHYYPWRLTKWFNDTFGTPLQLEFRYISTVQVPIIPGMSIPTNKTINQYGWIGSSGQLTHYIIKAEQTNPNSPIYHPTAMGKFDSPQSDFLPITFSLLSIDTVNGQSGVVTCTRESINTHTRRTLAFSDELSVKADLSALDLKQDKLSESQIDTINSNVDDNKTVVYYDNIEPRIYDIYGTMNVDDIRVEGSDITDVKIGRGVKTLGTELFMNSPLMTSIELPDSLKTIGVNSFTTSNIDSLVIPDSVETINDYAFSSARVVSITVGSGVETIGNGAFDNCNDLTSLVFKGKTIEEVEEMANYPWGITNTSIIKTWNVASQEWVLEQLSALEARIAALENN